MVCHAIGLETGSASQDYIQIYDGDAKLLTDSLEHIQKAANQILNAIGAEGTSAPAEPKTITLQNSDKVPNSNPALAEIP